MYARSLTACQLLKTHVSLPCAIRTKSVIVNMLCNTQVIPVFLEKFLFFVIIFTVKKTQNRAEKSDCIFPRFFLFYLNSTKP